MLAHCSIYIDSHPLLGGTAFPEALMKLSWRERGGPSVRPPTRKGFGTRLIERGLTGQIGGVLSLDYPPEGVTCTVEAPLRDFQAE